MSPLDPDQRGAMWSVRELEFPDELKYKLNIQSGNSTAMFDEHLGLLVLPTKKNELRVITYI